MDGPLDGIRVLDFSQLAQGPAATQTLGDLGADVVKVEPPGGDWMRRWAMADRYVGGESISFLALNRNKRSIVIDLKRNEGLQAALRLADQADVVVENFRPGVMDRLGVGYGVLSRRNPQIIYCASTGYGREGPYRDRPGQDLLVQAMAGIPWLQGAKTDPPIPVGVGIADFTAANVIVWAILAAVVARERSGIGQRVDLSLLDSLLALHSQEFTILLNGLWPSERGPSGTPSPFHGAPYGIYGTSDGWLAIAMTRIDHLTKLVGIPGYEWCQSTSLMDSREALRLQLAERLGTRTTAAWLAIFEPAGIWASRVRVPEEILTDPQVAANGLVVTLDHPDAGRIQTVGPPVRYSVTRTGVHRPPPRLGEHASEILADAGYEREEAERLLATGAFGS